MSPPNPTIVLVRPRRLAQPTHLLRPHLATILNAQGYPTVILPLPSAGATPPHASFDGDVNAIRDCLTALVEVDEEEVVLVVHSYTGMPGAEAPRGLGRKEREKKGLKGGVVRLVFVSAYAMAEGFRPTDGGKEMPGWMKVDVEKGVVLVEPEDAKRIFYNDLPSAEADEWASKLTHQSIGVYSSMQTYAAWRHIPSTYVIGEQDQTVFTPQVAQMMIEEARRLEPGAFDVVEKCEGGGHCLMISRPKWLADVLRRAAGEIVVD